MKTYKITFVLFIALFAISCSNSENKHQHSEDIDIELNDGQKWQVNSEMTPYILAGEKMLNEYDPSDYKMLATELKNKNNDLIKSCTMDGKSHDELHKWLHPHMELVKDLGNAENKQKANEIIKQLKESFHTYNTHFQ